MMRRKGGLLLAGVLGALLLGFLGIRFVEYLQAAVERRKETAFLTQTKQLRQRIEGMIQAKERSTLALALAMRNDRYVLQGLSTGRPEGVYFRRLSNDFRRFTNYKNIWFQLLDPGGTSIFKSWSEKRGGVPLMADQVRQFMQNREPTVSITPCHCALFIKAMVPIYESGRFLGALEVISHFNSIAKQLEKDGIESLVVTTRELGAKIDAPVFSRFLEGRYVATQDLDDTTLRHAIRYGLDRLVQSGSYTLLDDHLVVAVPLKGSEGTLYGHYFAFVPITSVESKEAGFFLFRAVMLAISFVGILLTLATLFFWYVNRRQKAYFKKIIDTSSNIIVVTDGRKIREVNRAFFDYFDDVKSLEEFMKKHSCLCDLFEKEEGYLQAKSADGDWLETLIRNPGRPFKVKIRYGDKTWYFMLHARPIDEERGLYSLILSDITEIENYRHMLERLATTDPLTGIGNRRWFETTLKEEVARVRRYGTKLSLIMFDIDHFKKINDTYGHDIGDKVLKEVVRRVRNIVRESDIFCRVGGEEFVLLLPNTEVGDAMMLAERIRQRMEKEPIEPVGRVTISLGVVEAHPDEDPETLYKRLDAVLYSAKREGRNRVAANL